MSKEILMLSDIEIEKNNFYRYKNPFCKRKVDIEKVFLSNEISFGEKNYKYFIGHL